MTPEEIWWLALGIGAAVVAVVAVLLGLIIATARSIDERAAKIWQAGKQIAGNTAAIWMLRDVALLAGRVRRSAETLQGSIAAMNDLLREGPRPQDRG